MGNELNMLCVKTSLKLQSNDAENVNQGSGTIIKINEEFYVLTAEHCIHGKNNEYKDKITNENIVIEWQKQYNSDLIPLSVLSIVDFCSDNDWSLLKIENPNIDFDFSNICYSSDFVEDELINFNGYQNLNQNEFAPFKGTIVSIADTEFKISAEFEKGGEGGDIVIGLSGSGVFISKANKFYLIGNLKSIIGDDALNNHVKCCPISNCRPLEKKLTKIDLDIVEFWNKTNEDTIIKDTVAIIDNLKDGYWINLKNKCNIIFGEDGEKKAYKYLIKYDATWQKIDKIQKSGDWYEKFESTANEYQDLVEDFYSGNVNNEDEAQDKVKKLTLEFKEHICKIFKDDSNKINLEVSKYKVTWWLMECALKFTKKNTND